MYVYNCYTLNKEIHNIFTKRILLVSEIFLLWLWWTFLMSNFMKDPIYSRLNNIVTAGETESGLQIIKGHQAPCNSNKY